MQVLMLLLLEVYAFFLTQCKRKNSGLAIFMRLLGDDFNSGCIGKKQPKNTYGDINIALIYFNSWLTDNHIHMHLALV